MKTHTADYWNHRYLNKSTPWDIGYSSPALMTYFSQSVLDRGASILIPGGGRAYEITGLWEMGYTNVSICDWSEQAILDARKVNPKVPADRFLIQDFFEISGQFDYILEQTFFCALPVSLRPAYIQKCKELLLQRQGHFVGLLFNVEFEKEGPPFGGNVHEYRELFKTYFNIKTLAPSMGSIQPRDGNEVFIEAQAKKS